MLQNIFLKTVRDYRFQVLIWGTGLGLMMLAQAAAYESVFGTGTARDKAIAEYQKAVESLSILTGKVYDLDTVGGFLTSKIGGMMPVLLGLWTLLAGSALIRSEEEQGSLDLLLSTPHSPRSVLLQKWAGLVVALVGIVTLSCLGLLLGVAVSQLELDPLAAVLAHLNWLLLALVFGGLGLLFSQLTTRKAAAGWAGGILAASFLLNNLVQNVEPLQWSQYFYPFYYASLSQPLARSVGTNWVGLAVLAFSTVLLVGVAGWMYRQRDHNGYFELFSTKQPAVSTLYANLAEPKSAWLSNTFTLGLRAALPGVIIWGLSISAYMLLIMSVFNDIKGSMVELVSNIGIFKQLGFLNLTSNENILSLFIFVFLVLLAAAYAVVQVGSWTAEENEGRLELVLSTPEPRGRLLLSYFGVALVSSALMIALIGAIFALCTWLFNVPVNTANALAAFFGLWIVCMVIEAVGFILAAFGPLWAVGVTTGLVIISYLSDLLQQVLKLPDQVGNLSVFRQYGRPLSEGLHWIPQLVMVALSITFIVFAILRFGQRDLSK